MEAVEDELVAHFFVDADRVELFGDVGGVAGVEEEGVGVAADFWKAGCTRYGDGCAALHGFQRGEAEAFVERWEAVGARRAIKINEV